MKRPGRKKKVAQSEKTSTETIYEKEKANSAEDPYGLNNIPAASGEATEKDRNAALKKMQEKLNFVKNKALRTTILWSIALFIAIGYLFFFTSQMILPDGYRYNATALNTTLEMAGNRTITIVRWDYSPTQKIAEIELEVNNRSFDDSDHYNIATAVKTKGEEKRTTYKAIISDPDYFVIQMEAPDDWGELVFYIQINDDRYANSILRLTTNQTSVSVVEEIQAKTRTGYLQQRMENSIKTYEQCIAKLQTENQELNEKITRIQERNEQLVEEEELQTAAEIAKTEAEIAENRTLVKETEEQIVENTRSIETYRQLIQQTKEAYEKSNTTNDS